MSIYLERLTLDDYLGLIFLFIVFIISVLLGFIIRGFY